MKKMSMSEAGRLGAIRTKEVWRERYQKNPKLCAFCKTELPYEKRHNQFCNHSCAASRNNQGVQRHGCQPKPCVVCGVITRGKHCSYKCNVDHRYIDFVEQWLNGNVTGVISNGLSTSKHIRRWLIEQRGEKCEECGWAKFNPFTKKIPIQIEHKNGNSGDNRPENLMLLCPSCHSLTPTFGGRNRGNGRKNRINISNK